MARATPAGPPRSLPADWLGFNGEAVTGPPGLWDNARFVAAVAALHPEALRIFGGTTANFWDWRRGTFVPTHAAGTVAVPPDLAAARSRVRVPLTAWARLVRAAHATPIYDLNLVSSSLSEQLAMLRAARSLGLPVSRVELGNELYLDRYRTRFADGAAYGRVASRWAAAIRRSFPGVRVAAAGFVPEDAGLPVKPRELTWNAGLLQTLRGVDALTFHPYFQSGLPADARVASAASARTLLSRPTLHWAALAANVLARLPAGVAAWLTEYNLFDRAAAVHTTWAQGLALSSYSLDLLADPRVDQADIHALTSSAPFGALLVGSDGLAFGSQASSGFHQPPGHPRATRPFALSATGVAARALLASLGGARSARMLAFTVHSPGRGAARNDRMLRGALLASQAGQRALVLNLAAAPVRLASPQALLGSRFEQLSAAPGSVVYGLGALARSSGTLGAGGLLLPGYSLTTLG